MKKMTKFFALALLAGAMVSCSTEDTASTTANGKVAVQFTGGISVNTRASGTTWDNGDRIGITDIDNDTQGRRIKLRCPPKVLTDTLHPSLPSIFSG